jgi:hypothetical protein
MERKLSKEFFELLVLDNANPNDAMINGMFNALIKEEQDVFLYHKQFKENQIKNMHNVAETSI